MSNFKFNKEHKHWLTVSSPFVLATLLALPSTQLQAAPFDDEEDEEDDAPLTTQRLNEYTNSAEIIIRNRDNDSGKFGEYNALDDQGVAIDGNIHINNTDYEGGSAEYYKLRAEDLGTQNREVEVEVGKQGSHSFNFSYEESERQVWDSFDTPYNLSNDQTLPAGFPDLNDGTLDTEASVSGFMNEHELSLDREKVSLGYMRKLAKGWTFNVGYSHEKKDGHKDLGMMDGTSFQPVIFALPVEYKTDTVNLALEYVAKDYQVQFAYEVSAFDNGSTSTVIDSPYTGGTRMRIAQEPDNLFQQISVNGNFRFSPMTRATWFLAYNEATQDEDLLQMNENQPGLGTGTGSRTEADAEVTQLIARLGVSTRVNKNLNLSAKYSYQDKDTKTDPLQITYSNYDRTNASTNDALTPDYDTTIESLALSGKYKLPNRSRLRAGYIFEEIERPRQDREETEEDTYWVSWQTPMMGAFNAKVKYSFADRDGTDNDADNISQLMDPGTSGHPDEAVRYTLGDRKQNKYQFNATYGFSNTASIGTNVQVWDDDYDATVGLQTLKGQMFTVDLAFRPTRVLAVSMYTGMQRFTYDQRSTAGTDWTQETEQKSWVSGVNVDWEAIPNKLAVNLGLRYTDSVGEIHQVDETPAATTALPDLETTIATVELGAEYFLDKQTTLLVRAVYEDYDETNWAYDGFGTIQASGGVANSYLTGGLDSPNYKAGLIEFGVRHEF